MIRIILAFVVIFGLFFFGIKAVREMSGMEKWQLTKLIVFSIVCAVLTTLAMIGIVLIF